MTEPTEMKCLFLNHIKSCVGRADQGLLELSDVKYSNILEASKNRHDTLHESLNSKTQYRYHKSCFLMYVDKKKIAGAVKRKLEESKKTEKDSQSSSKKCLRSQEQTTFNFKQNCLICGEKCSTEKDPKNPKMWEKNPVSQCSTAERFNKEGGNYLSFKDSLLVVIIIFDISLILLFFILLKTDDYLSQVS